MRRLRTRERVDTLKSEGRPRKRGRFGRYAYLALLTALVLALIDFLVGGLLYLRGEGMVSRDVSVIAPEYTGTVVEITVAEGDLVEGGQLVARMRSQAILSEITRLSARLAEPRARLSEIRVRKRQLEALIPAARERAAALEDDRERLSKLKSAGLITNTRQVEAIDDAYKALEDRHRLESELDLVTTEEAEVNEILTRARDALDEIEMLYNDGWLLTPTDGIVGTITVGPGGGLDEGETFMEIFRDEAFVLAFVPIGTLYTVEPGDRVSVRFGLRTLRGEISELLPLASRLPQEFQRAFQTVRREQLVRVTIDPGSDVPPLFTKTTIAWVYSPAAIAADAIYDTGRVVTKASLALRRHGGEWLRQAAIAVGRWSRETYAAFADRLDGLLPKASNAKQRPETDSGVTIDLETLPPPSEPAVGETQ